MSTTNPNSKDSNTNVYPDEKRFHGGRKVVSFRCNEKLWKTFKKRMKQEGDSVCHILEAMISAVLGTYPNLVNNRNTITIENLQVRRVVQRHRRVKHEVDAEANFYDKGLTQWRSEEGSLNSNGHAIGCGCSLCEKLTVCHHKNISKKMSI